MKSKTKWGTGNTHAHRFIICPNCNYIFVNRKFRRCPKCEIGLFAGSELLTDRNGYWWHPKEGWIRVLKIAPEVGSDLDRLRNARTTTQ